MDWIGIVLQYQTILGILQAISAEKHQKSFGLLFSSYIYPSPTIQKTV